MARAHGLYNGVTNGGSAVAGIFTRRRDTHGAHIQCRPPAQSRAPDASNLCWWACTAAVTSASASPPRCSGTVGSGRTNTGLAVAAYEYTTDHREDAPGPGAVRFGSEAWSVFPNGLELAAMISQVYMMAATLQVPPSPPLLTACAAQCSPWKNSASPGCTGAGKGHSMDGKVLQR